MRKDKDEEAGNKLLGAEMSRKIKRTKPESQRHILTSAGIFPLDILHPQEEAAQPNQENKKQSHPRKKSKPDTSEVPAFGLK